MSLESAHGTYTDSWTHADAAEAPSAGAEPHDPDLHSEHKLLWKMSRCGSVSTTDPAPSKTARATEPGDAWETALPSQRDGKPPQVEPEPRSVAPAEPKRGRLAVVVSVLVAANVALGAGLFVLWQQSREHAAPVAAMSADVQQLKADQAGTREKLEGVQAKTEKHDAALVRVAQQVDAVEARQDETERDLREHELRESRDMAALQARMKHVERGVVDGAYALSLKEAVKVIDSVRPPPQKLVPRDPTRGPIATR